MVIFPHEYDFGYDLIKFSVPYPFQTCRFQDYQQVIYLVTGGHVDIRDDI